MPTVITDDNVLNMEAEIDGLFQPGRPANNEREKKERVIEILGSPPKKQKRIAFTIGKKHSRER